LLLRLFRPRPEAAAAAPAPTPPFRSWALADLLKRRSADRPWRVLDLGPASNHNLAWFAAHGATYTVESLYGTIVPCRMGGRLDAGCMRTLPDLLTYAPGTHFDVVLAWDLFDFLGPSGVNVLGERLAPCCDARTLVHAAVSREGRVPPRPGHWEMVDERSIRLTPAEGPLLGTVRFTDASLVRALGPFRVHKSYLLQNGLQEYLFERDGAA
jgi:hypothetical protein